MDTQLKIVDCEYNEDEQNQPFYTAMGNDSQDKSGNTHKFSGSSKQYTNCVQARKSSESRKEDRKSINQQVYLFEEEKYEEKINE